MRACLCRYYVHECHFLPFLPCAPTFNYGARMRTVVLTLLLLSASAAGAQIGLPAVRLPPAPGVTLPNVPAAGVLDIDKSAAALAGEVDPRRLRELRDRKSTRLNSSHLVISYAVFC